MMRADDGRPDDGLGFDENPAEAFFAHTSRLQQQFQVYLDRTVPHVLYRWTSFGALLFLFLLRILFSQGWYIVCYALGIYLLNLFLAFLSPKFDPSLEADLAAEDVEEGAPGLPSSAKDEEFRPFIRRLPEFKFWLSATRATLISIVCTITEATNVPVYWPILLIYFCLLFALTMRRQIKHMIKYRYIPFDIGRKARYGGAP